MRHPAAVTRQAGLSLLEWLVALSLGLILVTTLIAQVLASGRGQRLQAAQAQMAEDAQVALDLLRADFKMAGHAWPLRSQISPSGQASWHDALGAPALTVCDAGFASLPPDDRPSCAASELSGGAGSSAVELAYEVDAATSVVGSDDRPTDCLGNSVEPRTLADGRRVFITFNRWQISSSGGRIELRCGGRGRTGPQPLVDNVERMRLSWGLPVDETEGTALRYVSAADAGDVSGARAVRICLQLRSAEPVLGPEDVRQYRTCDGSLLISEDGRLRRSFVVTVAWRHLRPR